MRVQAFHFMCATKSDIECVCVQQKESQKVRVCMCVWERERTRARARERERERDRGETGKAAMDFFVCCNSSLDRSSLGWWNEGWGEISATSGQVTFRPKHNLSDFKKRFSSKFLKREKIRWIWLFAFSAIQTFSQFLHFLVWMSSC